MRFLLLYHSLLSDWNHGNAHFLRGVVRELQARGHTVCVFEPEDGWSRSQLIAHEGAHVLEEIEQTLQLQGLWQLYAPERGLPEHALESADVILLHEWCEPQCVAQLVDWRRRHPQHPQRILFHDTHHRAISDPQALPLDALQHFDGALVFGESLRQHYLAQGWIEPVWTWHEAADTRWFTPRDVPGGPSRDLVWIGNWGDGERDAQLHTFLLKASEAAGLSGALHGVRYPQAVLDKLEGSRLRYSGWLPNHRGPEVYARSRMTLHIPRRYYTEVLPGIPTIRVFEALACGIPLICSPWDDAEGLFRPGEDYLVAKDGKAMHEAMRALLDDAALRQSLIASGLERIRERHTCAHRVDTLLTILKQLGLDGTVTLPHNP